MQVVVHQGLEKVETLTRIFSLGCCKVETESQYLVKDAATGRVLLEAAEDSLWCLRNPCCCCDCICWCFHCKCGSRRSFTLRLAEQQGDPMVLEMTRPCASECLPCCLQSLAVSDLLGNMLGSVKQVLGYSPPCTACGKFEVSDAEDEVQYLIRTPCVVTTCCYSEASFDITDTEGNQVGEITKTSSNLAKELFTDRDRFLASSSYPFSFSSPGSSSPSPPARTPT